MTKHCRYMHANECAANSYPTARFSTRTWTAPLRPTVCKLVFANSHQSHICLKQATTFLRLFYDFLRGTESLTNRLACINVCAWVLVSW